MNVDKRILELPPFMHRVYTCKTVKSEIFRSDCICMRIHFQCLGVMLPKKMTATFPHRFVFTALKVKRTPKCSQKAMLQMLILQERPIHSRVISGCKPGCDGDSGFPNCSVIWIKQQLLFAGLLMMDCQKHSLEHCFMGLFGWMSPTLS